MRFFAACKVKKRTIMGNSIKNNAVEMAKKMLSDKKEVVRWIRTEEPYKNLEKKGITLGRIGN